MPNATENLSRMSKTAVFSFSSGIFLILVTLVAVALLNIPKSAVAEGTLRSCPLAEVSLDPGYGVGRTALLPVCRDAADQAASGNTTVR